MSFYNRLFPNNKKANIWALLDPDNGSPEDLAQDACNAESEGASVILIGGSLILSNRFDDVVLTVKDKVNIPVVLFPGNSRQISPRADGMLFISLLSGRNSQYLISEQVMAAPVICALNLPVLPTAYLLIESGTTTSAEYISNTKPIPRNKSAIAVAHAQAAMLLGMQAIYLEAGSGADNPVPSKLISAVTQSVNIPVIVGGGIRTCEQAMTILNSNASAIVIGTALEGGKKGLLSEIVKSSQLP